MAKWETKETKNKKFVMVIFKRQEKQEKKKGTQRESEREREWVELDNISNLVDQETESKSETGKHF